MEKLISVIVPIYNVGKYLDKCLESLKNQSYKNLEIILVNDGSTDDSLKTCNHYSDIDSRFMVYSKSNGGASSARNYGLHLCKGDYISFIDSDDYISDKMYEMMVENIEKYNVDISICNFNLVKDNNVVKNISCKDKSEVYDNSEFFSNLFGIKYYQGYLWNKLFSRKSIFKDGQPALFDERIHICEDLIFIFSLSNNVSSVYYDSELYLYNYVKREGSVINTFSEKNLLLFDTYEKIINYAKLYNKSYIRYYKFLSLKLAINTKSYIKDNKVLTETYGSLIKKIKREYIIEALMSKHNRIFEKVKLIIKYCYTL